MVYLDFNMIKGITTNLMNKILKLYKKKRKRAKSRISEMTGCVLYENGNV